MKFQTPIKISTLPPKVYGNCCLLNNTRPTHLKREINWGYKVWFYYQTTTNFIAKWMVEITSLLIKLLKSKVKVFGCFMYDDWKQIQSSHDWWWEAFCCHRISDGKLLVTRGLGGPKCFCHHTHDNKKFALSILWQLKSFNRQSYGNRICFCSLYIRGQLKCNDFFFLVWIMTNATNTLWWMPMWCPTQNDYFTLVLITMFCSWAYTCPLQVQWHWQQMYFKSPQKQKIWLHTFILHNNRQFYNYNNKIEIKNLF